MEGEFLSAEEAVFQHLRRAILSGEIRAQTPMNQVEIANSLGVSRIPVRDALRRLQSAGLLVVLPNRRAVVPNFTVSEVDEIFEMRALLEGYAARCAVPNLTAADLTELSTLAELLRRLPDVDGYLQRHEAFHDLVVQRAQLPRVRREVTRLREMLTPYIRIHGAAYQSAELADGKHDDLVAALRTRNPKKAEAAFIDHVRMAGRELMTALECLRAAEQRPTTADVNAKPVTRRAGKSRARLTTTSYALARE